MIWTGWVLGSDKSASPAHFVVEIQKQVGEGAQQSSHLHRVDFDVRRHSVRGVGPNVGDRPCEGENKGSSFEGILHLRVRVGVGTNKV